MKCNICKYDKEELWCCKFCYEQMWKDTIRVLMKGDPSNQVTDSIKHLKYELDKEISEIKSDITEIKEILKKFKDSSRIYKKKHLK